MKRYIPLMLPASAIIVIIVIAIAIRGMSLYGTFELKTLSGSTEALDGINISGYQLDGAHGERFEITNGGITRDIEYYESYEEAYKRIPVDYGATVMTSGEMIYRASVGYVPSVTGKYTITHDRQTAPSQYNPDFVQITETTFVRTKSVSPYIEIRRDKRNLFSPDSLFCTKADLKWEREHDFTLTSSPVKYDVSPEGVDSFVTGPITTDFMMAQYTNVDIPETYGYFVAEAAGEIFYTYPSDKRFTGINGIYRITELVPWYDNQGDHIGASVPIVEFDTEEFETVGLHAVNDNLLLLVKKDEGYGLRRYKTDGTFADELELPDLVEKYIAYADDDGISFSSVAQDGIDYTIISVSIGENLALTNVIRTPIGKQSENVQLMALSRANGKIVVVASITPKQEPDQFFSYMASRDIIYVFDVSSMIYSGEILTDKAQDMFEKNISPYEGGKPVRYISGIEIYPATEVGDD